MVARKAIVFITLISFCSSSVLALSHAEVYAGFVIPTGMSNHGHFKAEQMNIGDFGTTISIAGLFPVAGRFSLSPTATFISTSSRAPGEQFSNDYKLEYRQNDLGVEALWIVSEQKRLRAGVGAGYGWWNAATQQRIDFYDQQAFEDRRYARGQAWLARAVVHMMLRSPRKAGVSVRAVWAMPLTGILQEHTWAASGYVGLGIGFSMSLNRY